MASEPEPHLLGLSKTQSALLYNLLCDNARPWNANLREQLAQQVTPTDAHNAKVFLQTGRWEGR